MTGPESRTNYPGLGQSRTFATASLLYSEHIIRSRALAELLALLSQATDSPDQQAGCQIWMCSLLWAYQASESLRKKVGQQSTLASSKKRRGRQRWVVVGLVGLPGVGH